MSADTETPLRFGERRNFNDCVHCGLCLDACPTYLESGLEPESPRGRIYLMKALSEGRIEATSDVVRHFDLCLGCRACETACPSGVGYGHLIEMTREWVEQRRPDTLRGTVVRDIVVGQIMTDPGLFRLAIRLSQIAAGVGLMGIAKALMPPGFDPGAWSRRLTVDNRVPLPRVIQAVPPVRGRVALLTGCVMDAFFSRVNEATARVLARQGWEVHVPRGQVCCGALLTHAGLTDRARTLAATNSHVFLPEDVEFIVTNAAGCGAQMKDGSLLAGTPASAAAQKIAAKSRDVSEVLNLNPLRGPLSEIRARVAYHDACHLAHAQRVTSAPRALLAQIPGIELVPLRESDVCCGSAGSYNITEPEMAGRLGRRKAENILATRADVVVAGNEGCLVQIAASLEEAAVGRTGPPLPRPQHLVEVLDQATSPT